MPVVTTPGDGRSVLLDVINSIERTSLTLTDLTFSIPEINLSTDPLRNTKLLVTFNPGTGLNGTKVINYNRINKSELPTLTITRTTETTYYELIPALNAAYNLNLTENDLVDGPIPSMDPTITVDLPIADTSFVFYQGPVITTTGTIPPYTPEPANLSLGIFCDGFHKCERFTDGYGGEYIKILELYSAYCGFTGTTPPPPTTTAPPTTTPAPTTTPVPTTTAPPTTPPPTTAGPGFRIVVNGSAVTVNGEYVIS